jgi:hypothetical protein
MAESGYGPESPYSWDNDMVTLTHADVLPTNFSHEKWMQREVRESCVSMRHHLVSGLFSVIQLRPPETMRQHNAKVNTRGGDSFL